MRLIIIAAMMATTALPARADISPETTMAVPACSLFRDAEKLRTLTETDKEAANRFAITQFLSGKCSMVENSWELRIDEIREDYLCVAKKGIPDCNWVSQDFYNMVK